MESLPDRESMIVMERIQNLSGRFAGRVGLLQRVLPAYRAEFFDSLAMACVGGLGVFAGQPRADEEIKTVDHLDIAKFFPAHNWHIGSTNSRYYLCWQSGLSAWLSNWQPEVLIVEANPRYLSTRLAVNWMRARGRPVLGWGLGAPGVKISADRAREHGRQRFLSMFDGMIAYSSRGADQYRAMGVPTEKVFVALNAVAPRPVLPPPGRPMTFAEQPVVLFVGRLQARKQVDNLLRACAALPTSLQPRLYIIGDGPAREAFQRVALEFYPQAEFLGSKHGPDLEAYFKRADLFVLPGTGGLAVQEAMAYALPVIVAEGDGTQEDLVRPENGWLVPPGNQQVLTETLHQALSDVPNLRKMGQASFRIAREEVNIEAMVKVFVTALSQVSQDIGS